MNLAQIQTEFSQLLLTNGTSIESLQLEGPFSAESLLQLYRNNFYISLTEYLAACFPTVAALVGDDFFKQLARQFIKEAPLSEGNIEGYGEYFTDYIRQSPQTQSLPYLADISQLEWNLEQAKSYTSDTTFPFSMLAELTAEEQARVCFKLAIGVNSFTSASPIFSIWQGTQSGELDNIDMTQSESVLIYPAQIVEPEGAEVMCLSTMQKDLIQALQAGTMLDSLALTPDSQQQLTLWIHQGIISHFYLGTAL